MKISCGIIKDLLPLYNDDVCSEASRVLVEEHLSDCTTCKEELSKINKDFECPQLKMDEAKPIRAIAKIWKKDIMRAFVKGTVITLVICTLLVGSFLGLTQWKIIPVSAELLEVSDVCQLSDGRIVYNLNVTDNRDLRFIKFTTKEDGSSYMTPYRSVIEGKRTLENGLYNDFGIVDVAEENAYQKIIFDGIEITSCYIGPKDDGILIWKEGMELPPASKELEKIFAPNK